MSAVPLWEGRILGEQVEVKESTLFQKRDYLVLMAYDNLNNEQLILRDYLAAERTHLANERTLLAYERSAFIVLVTAMTIFKFFDNDAVMRIIAIILVPSAVLISVFGIYRFRKTRAKLAAFEFQVHR